MMNIRVMIVSACCTSVCSLLTLTTIIAQEKAYETAPADVSFGVVAAYDVNLHMPDFSALSGIATCCLTRYPDVTAYGKRADIFYRFPLFDRVFAELRGGVRDFGAGFRQLEMQRVAGPDRDAHNVPLPVIASFAHQIDATLTCANLEAGFGMRVIGGLMVYAGGSCSYWLRKEIRYSESIVDPPGIQYDNGAPYQRNAFSGDLAGAARFPLSLSGGIAYSIPVDRRRHLFLEPSLSYHHGMTSMIEQQEGRWYLNTVSLGLGVRYAPLGIPMPSPVPSPPFEADPPSKTE